MGMVGRISSSVRGRRSPIATPTRAGIGSGIGPRVTTGTTTRWSAWVLARGPRERVGVQLAVDQPAEGALIERDVALRVGAISYAGARIQRVELSVGGKRLGTTYRRPFRFAVPWSRLGPGEHRLLITAVDARGILGRLERRVRVSEYFDLSPRDGAVLTGERVRVRWDRGRFGPAVVRYRERGAKQWREAVGPSARRCVVSLRGLAPGKVYEFQPLGGARPGPLRTVTRVKGLAFSGGSTAGRSGGPTISGSRSRCATMATSR